MITREAIKILLMKAEELSMSEQKQIALIIERKSKEGISGHEMDLIIKNVQKYA